MNKANKLLLGILAFVVVCVVGYALFSDTITVSGTASAQGSFNIVGSCQTGVPEMFADGIKQVYDNEFKEGGYINDTCSFVGDEVTISVGLEYPTANRWFTIKLTNNGTIPAIMQEPILKSTIACIEEECLDLSQATSEQQRYISLFTKENNMIIGLQKGNEEPLTIDSVTDEQLKEFVTENEEKILKPGNSVYLAVRAEFYSTLGFSQPGELDFSHEVTYEYPFIQITE